ncbi:MAG: CPBP family intramembrane metalloprotease [Oscillospiraceae bacterium]|nr:CPBP family intramembrane metalloprotease [Oscillospiraceae bacterium]
MDDNNINQPDEQDIGQNPEQSENESNSGKTRGYQIICAKLGLSMCVYFICRLLAGWALLQFANIAGSLNETFFSLLSSLILIIIVYIIPVIITALIFKSFNNYKGKYRKLYKKPKRLARAMGTFPASFGFGYGIALLTLLVSYLISRFSSGHTYIEDLLRPTVIEPSSNLAGVFAMVFMLVVIAPVLEEFWVRGIMFDALKPFGTGMAIILTSIIFGLMHGSLYMLFYTTAYGFALGYIRYATGSLFIVTILHAIINSIAAGTLLLSSLTELTNDENRLINTIYIIYILAVFAMIIIGIIVFLSKIPAIKRFKIENSWTQTGPWRKAALFFVSAPVILMMILAFNEISGGLITNLFIGG